MKTKKRRIGIWQWGLALLLVLALAGPTAAAQQYQFQDLGTLPGMDSCLASDINNQGQIVGTANEGVYGSWWLKWRAYLKNPGQPMQDLGTIPGYENERYDALAINDSGVIVGSHGQWPTRAFIKYPDQPMEALLGGMVSRAHDINNLGQVVGPANPNWPWELYWNYPYSSLKNPDGSVVLPIILLEVWIWLPGELMITARLLVAG